MVFDANAYRATVNDYRRQGDMNALEGYLTQEIARLRESGTICAGVACTCGKDADALAEEDAAWQHNREQGLVVALSDLADLYRSSGAWYKCLETYEELRQCLIDEGLENTPAYASALVNAGYACLDATDPERAARLIEEALNALGDPDPEVPTAVLRARAHDALAVSWAMRGFAEQAEQASDAAAEAVSVCCATGEDFIGALSNHIATLAQIGRVDEAVSAVRSALESGEQTLTAQDRYTLMNLHAMVLYRAKRFADAGDAMAELIDLARASNDLTAQLPSIARNAATMYNRAGDAERAQSFTALADQLES
ncbi:MAG: tetratricopeptide repeat protein [Collinsella bouchesdurhonensis]|uniref:tetratricopeptide repeat protein n=1 Tax=Collinsella bouchesdurhonensis TaxID=1907654 RepID=UPI00096A97E0|nr:tetratricopeptide repeat protein [Collinsella bouchesdurhonensis]MDY3052989.1 tetratricopeptide repeat protein [Collinsella bouchesdurhonensis]